MSDGPVFIGGLAFSGKTPLRLALTAHPRIAMTRHTAMWSRYHERFGDLSRPVNLDRCLTAMLDDPHVATLDPDGPRLEREFRQGPSTYARLFDLLHTQHAQRLGKSRWGDQMGLLEQYADLVLTAYPTAQMIHMVRDPRSRHAAGANRHRQMPGRLGWETARWRHSADLATRNQRHYPGRYLVVRYEAFCAQPDAILRDVVGFLGEDYSPAMVMALADVTLDDRLRRARLSHEQQRAVAAFVERYARRQLLAYEYPVDRPSRTRLGPSFYLVDLPCNRAGIAAWRMVHSVGRSSTEVL